jgi:competence ComEA-like helix-hairpin-helix protein
MIFFTQYKKMIALCAIPIAVALTFFGYQVIHAQSTRSTGQTVNSQMQALLDAELHPTANAPSGTPLPDASGSAVNSPLPDASGSAVNSPLPQSSISPINSMNSKTSKPKATKKPRAIKRPTPTLNPDFKVNINHAAADDLVKLPGIGPSKAKAIIAYRKQFNAFKTRDELMKVKGIGPKIYEKIKDHLEL